LPKAKRRSS